MTLGSRLLFFTFNDFISIQGNVFTGGCKEIFIKQLLLKKSHSFSVCCLSNIQKTTDSLRID